VVAYELPTVISRGKPSITIDGFLGVDFLGRLTMTVDPRAETLTLQLNE